MNDNFINDKYIKELMNIETTDVEIEQILEKAKECKGLTHTEVAKLLQVKDVSKLLEVADYVKEEMFGKRIVLFAPLYISNYCTNQCKYCGYKCTNNIKRMKLTQEEIKKEIKVLEKIGHKRIALEVGEDKKNSDINYICESIKTIYKNSDIRRINVNIAATTVEEYKLLKECEIGTYLLFQETYNRKAYENYHPGNLKGNYLRQLYALDNAQKAGIDDVGGGVLFGLYDHRYEVISAIIHNEHLVDEFGVGFHTFSVPRLKNAKNVESENYEHIIGDEDFIKIVAIFRIAMPKAGLIISTREPAEFREKLINYGVSQMSAGSKTDVGGYSDDIGFAPQFELSDERSPKEVIMSLLELGKIPSYCTACYRLGRTGKQFMDMIGEGKIKEYCLANSILTLTEYIISENDEKLTKLANKTIDEVLSELDKKIVDIVKEKIELIKAGKKDQYI